MEYPEEFTLAAPLRNIPEEGSLVVRLEGNTIALFRTGGTVYAVDNRCPHMGFPLDRGSVHDCILTCHWHHARFDLTSGGTFDQFADDVRSFPVEVRGEDVWVDLAPQSDPTAHFKDRMRDGLERDIPLVIGKSVIHLQSRSGDCIEPFRIGLDFGVRNRQLGWGQGLTILTCMMNLVPRLDPDEMPRAMYHGLSAVARDCFGHPPRFMLRPLDASSASLQTLKTWFRRFVEVRDAEGAERCILTAIEKGADHSQMADMLFSAVTDHRYIQIGHPLDFTNKAFEALDVAGWDMAASVLASLTTAYANASRMEEANSWRNPIDLVSMLERTFEQLESIDLVSGKEKVDTETEARMIPILLGNDPQAIVDELAAILRRGVSPCKLSRLVAYAAALRIARFHTSNEFTDWDTALHTFTFANAVHQGLRRTNCVELVRGIFDAAMSIYLDRFLNVPAARLPEPRRNTESDAPAAGRLEELAVLLDQQQKVNEAGETAARYLFEGGSGERLMAQIGRLLLREDRDFHTIQSVEAACRQFEGRDMRQGAHILTAAARYVAAHSPTVRAQGQTYQIALRLHRGDHLYEDAQTP